MTTLEHSAPYALPPRAPARSGAGGGWLRAARHVAPWVLAVITAVAGVLRFVSLDGVGPNQFYDAAVRSMSMSWHNFLFGAFDPRAILAVDKPPLDLWLQVVSVKLFGWSTLALKLPEALAGTLAVPLLYDAVRRVAGTPAGLASAAVLALAPEAVLTARSDTMDSVMMLLVVAALWLTVRAVISGRRRPIVLAGVALGLAFNIKLLEALLPLPALALFYLLAARLPARRRLANVGLAAVALVGVGLSWAVIVSLAPGRHPWAVGSTDGSVWNAMFVFNGLGKVAGTASTSGGPGLLRLLTPSGWHFDVLFGCVLIAALSVGIAASMVWFVREREARRGQVAVDATGGTGVPMLDPHAPPQAFAISIAVWIAVALLTFDAMATMHTRYLEALSPAVAVALGYGAVTLAGLYRWRGRPATPSLLASTLALLCSCAYTLGFRAPSIAFAAAALIVSVLGAELIGRAPGRIGEAAKWLAAGLIIACALMFGVHETITLVSSKANDSLGLAVAPRQEITALSSYLRPRTAGLRYELAVDEPLSLAPLIIRDHRPLLPLTSFGGRRLTSLDALVSAARSGVVRYGLVSGYRCGRGTLTWAACTPAARWIRRHGIDVTADAGLSGQAHLYRISG